MPTKEEKYISTLNLIEEKINYLHLKNYESEEDFAIYTEILTEIKLCKNSKKIGRKMKWDRSSKRAFVDNILQRRYFGGRGLNEAIESLKNDIQKQRNRKKSPEIIEHIKKIWNLQNGRHYKHEYIDPQTDKEKEELSEMLDNYAFKGLTLNRQNYDKFLNELYPAGEDSIRSDCESVGKNIKKSDHNQKKSTTN